MSALRSVGSPRAQRQAEGERSQGLKHLKEQVDSSDVKKRVEEDLRARMDQIRHERAVGPAKKAFVDQEGDAPRRRVEAMGKGKLNDFEAEQFKEMAKLESEIHGLVAREEDLQLHDRLDDAKLRAVDAGVLRADAEDESLVKQKEMMSRQQRQERLVADRSARHELIQRQREHLMAQRSNIESDLAGLQSHSMSSASHTETVDKILMTRQRGGGETIKGGNYSRIQMPDDASGNTQLMVQQLATRYHEDRRKLQRMKEQQVQLEKEIESTKFSAWKPQARDEAAISTESQMDAQKQSRTEFAKGIRFEQSKRDLSDVVQSVDRPRPAAAATVSPTAKPAQTQQAHLQQFSPQRPLLAPNVENGRGGGDREDQHATSGLREMQKTEIQGGMPARTGNAMIDEINALKHDYVSRGGSDSSLLEAIAALERQVLVPSHGRIGGNGGFQDAAQMAGSRAVHAVYSNQWPGAPGPGVKYHSREAYGVPHGAGYSAPPPMHSDFSRMQEEMARIDREIEERAREAKKLQQQLQQESSHETSRPARVADRSESASTLGQTGVSMGGQGNKLTEDEEELMQLEANPKDSELYRLRKQHLKSMISLKYDIERLKQEQSKDEMEQQVEMMKKEHDRREWVLKQQQQLLEAKYRKHMAREKPFLSVGGDNSNKAKEAGDYSADIGFNMYVDYILGLPSKVNNQVQVVYGFYEGVSAKTEARSLPMTGVEHDGALLRSVMAVKRSFMKVAANDKFKLLIELQNVLPATADRGPRTMPVGWTMLRLFEEDGSFNRGLWRVPMFLPPVRPDFEPGDLVNVHRISDLEVFMRLVPNQQSDVHDRFAVNPDMTKMQYKYPVELKPKEEKKIAAVVDQKKEIQEAVQQQLQQMVPQGVPSLPLPGQAVPPLMPQQSFQMSMQQGKSATLEPEMIGPTAELQLQFHDLSGALFGHGHCQDQGPVYVRLASVLLPQGHIINTTISAHTDKTVSSPGLRFMQITEEDQDEEPEEEIAYKSVQGTWCTSAIAAGRDEGRSYGLNQGCMLQDVPCTAGTALLLELYREAAGPRQSTEITSADVLKTQPEEEDVLIAWATVPLFAKSASDSNVVGEGDEEKEPAEWTKAGLRLLTGVTEKELLAPPVISGANYDKERLKQAKYADVLSCDGLASSAGGATVILNAPLPTLRLTIAEPPPPKVDKFGNVTEYHPRFGAIKDAVGIMGLLGGGGTKGGRHGKKRAPDTLFKYHDTEAWIASPDPPASDELFSSDDGFDLYIDGARWMPDNVTLTSVTCFVATSKMNIYTKFEKDVDVRSMNVRCPLYLARKEVRKDPRRNWDPTLTLLVQVNGLQGNPADYVKSEKDAKKEGGHQDKKADDDSASQSGAILKLPYVIVGFAVLHLFVDPDRRVQPDNPEAREYILNEGSFQIPLFRGGLKEKEDLSSHSLDDEMRRLCSTVLVRIVKARRSEDGAKVLSVKDFPGVDEAGLQEQDVLIRPTPYPSAGYSSSSFSKPTVVEEVLYEQRLNAAASRTFSAAQTLFGIMGQRMTPEDEHALSQCDAIRSDFLTDFVRDMQKKVRACFKGSSPQKMLETKLNTPYLPRQGFLVSVDGVDNVSQDYFSVWIGALTSSLPQAMYYSTEGQVGSDLSLFYQMEFQADAASPRWTDGWLWMTQRETGQQGRMVVVIDVRIIVTEAKSGRKMKRLKNKQVIQLGFAILPIIGTPGNYVLSGNYRLPLYAMGPKPEPIEFDATDQLRQRAWGPSPQVLERIEVLDSKRHVADAMQGLVDEGVVHLVPGTSDGKFLTSVVCRVVDRNRYGEFVRPFIVEAGPSAVDVSCMPAGHEKMYREKPAKVALQKKLKDTVGSFSAHNGLMLDFFKNSMALPASISERPKSPRAEIMVQQESPTVSAQRSPAASPVRGAGGGRGAGR